MPIQPTPSPEAEAAVARVWPYYALPAPTICGPTNIGLNDHHLVTTAEGQYVLRVYAPGWRTAGDIAYELAVLRHLAARGVAAVAPLAREDGAYETHFDDGRGPRTAVVFPCAPGDPPDAADPAAVRACGRVLALIHQHTDGFTCSYPRFCLDLDHLLTQSAAALRPSLAHRPGDAAFVQETAARLRAGLEPQCAGLEWGFCHGDFHGGNVRLGPDGTLRIFDFDCGGMGWRAYDLSIGRLACGDEARWATFCAGYEEVRPLPAAARAALPWFAAARQVWRLALFATRAPRLLGGPVTDGFLDEQLRTLRERLGGLDLAPDL